MKRRRRRRRRRRRMSGTGSGEGLPETRRLYLWCRCTGKHRVTMSCSLWKYRRQFHWRLLSWGWQDPRGYISLGGRGTG